MGDNEVWQAGEAYERYVGRWSRKVAAAFVDWLALTPGLRVLDVGCGTGALVETVLDRAKPAAVVGVDQSTGFVGFCRRQVAEPRARFERADAQALPFDDASFDAGLSGLALNFFPDPARAVAELRRVVRPAGTIALYVWDYAGEMQFMRRFWDAAAAIDPAASELDEGVRFPICRPDPLRAVLRECGVEGIEDRTIDVPTVFTEFDDFWTPFLGGQGPAPTFVMRLAEDAGANLRERLRSTLPIGPDGRIALVARALAVRARAPRA